MQTQMIVMKKFYSQIPRNRRHGMPHREAPGLVRRQKE